VLLWERRPRRDEPSVAAERDRSHAPGRGRP